MKKVSSYTTGWDSKNKKGYLTVQDETEQNHLLGNLEREDFEVMLGLLKDQGEVFIDENQWIVAGWQGDENKNNRDNETT